MNRLFTCLLTCLLPGALLPGNLLRAQQRVQVVTKTVEKQLDYQPGEVIRVEGEKATIAVTGWSGKGVKVVLKLVAKAPTQETARRELDFQRYILQKHKQSIHLKNYFVLPKGRKALNALLLAEYEIWVPQQATVTITNRYGNVHVTGTTGRTTVSVKYGNTTLDAVGGDGQYTSYFGDFTARNSSGTTRARLSHTKTSIEGLSGEADFENTLSDISISGLKGVKALRIQASKSDISLSVDQPAHYQYQFKTEFGDITPPGKVPGRLVQKAGLTTWAAGHDGQPLITAITTFGNITLQTP
jgi:hypothetical protein